MRENPKPGEIYRHFKNKLYQIVTIAHHSETGEQLVIYQALYGEFGVCARPLDMFMSEVDSIKYPKVTQKYRFEKVEANRDTDTKETVEKDREHIPVTQEVDGKAGGLHESHMPESQTEEDDEQAAPELMAFLDAETYHEKYKIIQGMERTITDRLINDFAVILDVVIPDGELARRYDQLKQCVSTMAKYETTRFR